jgi:hypothetical protein
MRASSGRRAIINFINMLHVLPPCELPSKSLLDALRERYNSEFHRQYDHRHIAHMQSAKQGQRSFAVKLSNVPVVVFEDQLAGKENAMRKFGADRFRELRQLLYRVSAEAEISLRGKAPVVAEVDKVIERLVGIAPHRFQQTNQHPYGIRIAWQPQQN